MKKTLIAASLAIAVSLSACGKNDAADTVAAANDTALNGTLEGDVAANGLDDSGNVTVAEDGTILDNTSSNGTDAVANTQ